MALTGAVASLWMAVGPPFGMLDMHLLTAHMAQHLTLMLITAPLLLRGLPFIKFRLHPVFCWMAATLVVIGWHVPAAFTFGMQWHRLEQASFLAAGILFWLPVMRNPETGPRWMIPLYLFLATLPCDALSAYLTFCDHVVYKQYLTARPMFDLSPLQDQSMAGALMWVTVTFAYLLPAVVIVLQNLSAPSYAESSSRYGR